MSKVENFAPELFATPNVSVANVGCCGMCEKNHAKNTPKCQNVNLGRGGGAR
jgi:hypothetical protein